MLKRNEIKKEKRMRIIMAAAETFAQKGFAKTVMADIAAKAEVGKGTLYEYFDSKDDLFFAVFEWMIQYYATSFSTGLGQAPGSIGERLKGSGMALIIESEHMIEYFALVMEFWAASGASNMRDRFKAAFRNAYQSFRSIISLMIREGMAAGEFRKDLNPEHVASGIIGSLDAMFLQKWFDESFDLRGAAESFINVILDGLSIQGPEGE